MGKNFTITSWWLNQPIWNILVKMGSFPQVGVKIKNIWNHQLDYITKPFVWYWYLKWRNLQIDQVQETFHFIIPEILSDYMLVK